MVETSSSHIIMLIWLTILSLGVGWFTMTPAWYYMILFMGGFFALVMMIDVVDSIKEEGSICSQSKK
jgi:hypothetical protein